MKSNVPIVTNDAFAAINMTAADRQRARAAMRAADALTDGVLRLLAAIRGTRQGRP